MEISKAALPPIQPANRPQDRTHPLFPLYERHRTESAFLLVEADSFEGWLFKYEREAESQKAAEHPRFREFQEWCREAKAGARPCCPSEDAPRGLIFPHNFRYWLDGGRW